MSNAVERAAQPEHLGADGQKDGPDTTQNSPTPPKQKSGTGQKKANVQVPGIIPSTGSRASSLIRCSTRSLIRALNLKDQYTLRHSERVTSLAVHLATVCRVESRVIRVIRLSGLLHDVGKVTVSGDVLNKTYPLTQDEMRMLKAHANTGFKLLKSVNHADPVTQAVRHHHERWDGKGYPDRLEGKDIPLASRFVGLADAFDAMASNRPYRRQLSREKLIQELHRERGEQFDPAITDKLLGWYKTKRYISGTLRPPPLARVESRFLSFAKPLRPGPRK